MPKIFFERIINFIRNTTWLQPFMVAALMFFSIAMIPITSMCFRNFFLLPNDSDIFYRRYEKNQNGADKLFSNFISYKSRKINISEIPEKEFKYFVLFLNKKNMITSGYTKSFYEILGTKGADGRKIILYTIYVDNDIEFKKILDNNKLFFEEVLKAARKNIDFINGIISEKTVNKIVSPDFVSPLLLLVNFDNKDPINVYFDVKGNDDYEKINFLYNCWNN